MGNELKEQIATLIYGKAKPDNPYVEHWASACYLADQILNFVKEELEGLTIAPDNPYYVTGIDTEYFYNKYPEFQVYHNGKEAQLSHTISEIKEWLK